MNRDNLAGRSIILHLDAVADLELVVTHRLSVAGDLRGTHFHAEPLRLAVGHANQKFAMSFFNRKNAFCGFIVAAWRLADLFDRSGSECRPGKNDCNNNRQQDAE